MQLGALVFSREGCVQCNATYRALNAKGIEYKVLTVTEDVADDLRELGFQQLPVVKAPGDQRSKSRPREREERTMSER